MRIFLLALIACFMMAFAEDPGMFEKSRVIILKVDEVGLVTDGHDTIPSDELSEYIRERLFKSYMGTGKMYDRIRVEKINDGPIYPVWEILLKEIASGQKKALAEFCLHKYKKGYEFLSGKQQSKTRKQFPVLFQTDYH